MVMGKNTMKIKFFKELKAGKKIKILVTIKSFCVYSQEYETQRQPRN